MLYVISGLGLFTPSLKLSFLLIQDTYLYVMLQPIVFALIPFFNLSEKPPRYVVCYFKTANPIRLLSCLLFYCKFLPQLYYPFTIGRIEL